MSDRLEWYDVTIPPATPIATPLIQPLVFLQGVVTEIDVKILDGPCGTVGFYITAGGSQYIPRTIGQFVIPNDDYLVWPMQNAINSGSWGLVAYNLDSWPHLIQVAFHVNEIGSIAAATTSTGTDAIDTLTAAASAIQPTLSVSSDGLSLDSLLSSLPSESITPPDIPPLDTSGLQLGAGIGTS